MIASKFKQVQDALTSDIRSGRYSPGTRLPSLRQLTKRFDMSMSTIRQAMEGLERAQLVECRHGSGTYVRHPTPPPGTPEGANIGLLLPYSATVPSDLDPSAGELLPAVAAVLRRAGANLLVRTYTPGSDSEEREVAGIVGAGISGLLVYASYDSGRHKQYRQLLDRHFPVVALDGPIMGAEVDVVMTDNMDGAYRGTRCLVELGCRRVAFVGGLAEAFTSRERLEGCRYALDEAGLDLLPEHTLLGGFTAEDGVRAARRLDACREDLDGVFIANEPVALGFVEEMRRRDPAFLQQVQLCSFYEPNPHAECFSPFLLVRQPRWDTGTVAAEMLLERLQRQAEPHPRRVLLRPEIILPQELRNEVPPAVVQAEAPVG